MKAVSTIALGIALAFAGGSLTLAPAIAAKEKKAKAIEVSQDVGQNLNAAIAAIQKKDFATAQAKVAAAEAAIKNDGDRYNVGIVKFNLGQNTKNEQLQASGADMAIASNQASPEQLRELLNAQGVMAYNAKDFPKAVLAFGRAYELDPNGEGNLGNLIQAQTAAGQTAAANETMNKAIATAKAAGKPVPEALLKRQIAVSINGRGGVPAAILLELVSAYPNPSNWRDALIIYRDANKADAILSLDAMRLMRAAKVMQGESDFYNYASTAVNRGLPGEAKAVIDEGVAANALSLSRQVIKDLQSNAMAKIGADRAGLPKFESQANSSRDGKIASSTGDAYLGYKEYAKAAALFRTALQKGGVNAAEVNTHLGIALALSGDKAGATQAFGQVTGPRATLAKFWTTWLAQSGA